MRDEHITYVINYQYAKLRFSELTTRYIKLPPRRPGVWNGKRELNERMKIAIEDNYFRASSSLFMFDSSLHLVIDLTLVTRIYLC